MTRAAQPPTLQRGMARDDVSGPDAPAQSARGTTLADISRAIVGLYKDCYGKGPTKARTVFDDDVIVCVLEGGFQRGERTLVEAGRGDAVSEQREAFQDVLRERFIGTIEELTGRKVRSFLSGVDLETEVSAELFVLEPGPELGDERKAMRAWAQQTQRKARELREEQAALREEQARLRRGSSETTPPPEDG